MLHLHSPSGLCLRDDTEPIGKKVDHCNERTGYEMVSHTYQPKRCAECLRICSLFRTCPNE